MSPHVVPALPFYVNCLRNLSPSSHVLYSLRAYVTCGNKPQCHLHGRARGCHEEKPPMEPALTGGGGACHSCPPTQNPQVLGPPDRYVLPRSQCPAQRRHASQTLGAAVSGAQVALSQMVTLENGAISTAPPAR